MMQTRADHEKLPKSHLQPEDNIADRNATVIRIPRDPFLCLVVTGVHEGEERNALPSFVHVLNHQEQQHHYSID